MLKRYLYTWSFLIATFLVAGSLTAQPVVYKVQLNENSTMTIDGTSTIHDWTSTVEEVDGTLKLDQKTVNKGLKKGDKFEELNINIPVNKIISPRGSSMDNRTWDALKVETNPQIIFNLKNAEVTGKNDEGLTINASGDLTIAGVTKPVTLEAIGKEEAEGVRFAGSKTFKMTEYEVDPPSAMFGQIKTGDEVTINFNLLFAKQ